MDARREEGFAIGWDYGIHGIYPPDDAADEVLEGAKAASHQFAGRTKQWDRFTKKWLQLRLGAYKRNRVFDPGVTPDFLRAIDVKYCPITRVELTHGTGQDTDWSVDRIWNDGGYATTNLAVMSSRVNQIKWAMKPTDIIDHMLWDDRLTPREWMRLLAFVNYVDPTTESLQRSIPPVVMPPPRIAIRSPDLVLQVTSVMAVTTFVPTLHLKTMEQAIRGKKNKKAFDQYIQALSMLSRQALKNLDTRSVVTGTTQRIYSNGSISAGDVFWALEDMWQDDLTTQSFFDRWLRTFKDWNDMLDYLERIYIFQHYGTRLNRAAIMEQWGLANHGYKEVER